MALHKTILTLTVAATLVACSEQNTNAPESKTVAIQKPTFTTVSTLPKKGDIIVGNTSSGYQLHEELRKHSESELNAGNLATIAKLKSLRENYINSTIGSGAILMLPPHAEQDYTVQQKDSSETISITLPTHPYLYYTCSEMINFSATDYFNRCKPNVADYKIRLNFHSNHTYSEFTLELPSKNLSKHAENVQSIYFVSFELPTEAMETLTPFTSNETVDISGGGFSIKEQLNYNYKRKTTIQNKKGKTDITITGNFHGVAFINKKTGEILSVNSKL